MLTNQKILADESRKPYKDISRLSPRFRPVMRRCLARMETEKALVAKAGVFNFDVAASEFAGSYSVTALDSERGLEALLADLSVPEEGMFVNYHLQAMLTAITNMPTSRSFEPIDPRNQRQAGFLFTRSAGAIRARHWVIDSIDGKPTLCREPVDALLGGPAMDGEDPPAVAGLPPYGGACGLALGVPAKAVDNARLLQGDAFDLFSLIEVEGETDAMREIGLDGEASIEDALRSRAGAARRALALAAIACAPPVEAVIGERERSSGVSARTSKRWRYVSRSVTIDLSRNRRVYGDSPALSAHSSPVNHPVDSFWRVYRRCGCSPMVWEPLDDKRQRCGTCGEGRRVRVKEHRRGDASKGVVSREDRQITA